LSKANIITPNRLCSPLSVNWQVNYTGVNDAGTSVRIRFDWDDGTVNIENTTNISPGVFQTTSNHTYVSTGDKCNYRPTATLMVDGVLCSSSSQEQIVTVWDDDNHNGGHMHINPTVYPICFGNSANVRFQDLTQFNCVPPQENDVPNLYTRWIQWIYGTDITMTGVPVTINGALTAFPDTAAVITLPGPVTGSGVYSDIINVANDKQIGEYFQVTLRNWNYCNPYDDPLIPGPPLDAVNGDNQPVVTTAIILIVPYPDATINPVGNMCMNDPRVTLTAHDPGGVWSGPGVTGNRFDPASAGPGIHTIRYTITTGSGCTDSDQTTITVFPGPDATIAPIGPVCLNDPPITLIAHDAGGTWSGAGVTGNILDPAAAGDGSHIITYNIVNLSGCSSSDQITVTIGPTPDATITPVGTLCLNSPAVTLTAHDPGGTWTGPGVVGNTFEPSLAGIGSHIIGYSIISGNCSDSDQITIIVVDKPDATITPPGPVCLNDPLITLTSHDPGGIWTGVGVSGNVLNPAVAGIGNHLITYSIVNISGCSDNDQITVTINPSPDATITPVSDLCLNNPVITLTAHDPGGIWSGPGVSGSTFNPAIAGVGIHTIGYSIMLGNCSDSDKITITVLDKPNATITPVQNLCLNEPGVNLIAHDTGGSWTGPGLTGNFFDPVAAGTGIHTITYYITNANGCSDSDKISITVMQVPDATISPVDTLCVNNPAIVLVAKDTGGVWSGAVSNNIFDPSVAGAGSHIVIYNITNTNGCSDNDQITISVVPVPIVNITHEGTFLINSPPVTLNATPSGGIFSGEGVTGGIFTPSAAGLGIHVIKYETIPDRYGCMASDTIHIKVIMPPFPLSDFEPDTTGCAPLKVQFVNKSSNADSYLWDFGDNVFSQERDPVHIYYTPGSYIVSLAASNLSGQSIHTSIITVYQNPTAVFSVYPAEVTNSAQIVIFSNFSIYNDSQLWKFGDGNTSTVESPWHKYESEGTYYVTLIVKSKNGCTDSATFIPPIHVKFKVGKINFPNAFVWNKEGPTGGYWQDGSIDDGVFRPHFENVIEYKLQIFNRWGVLLYESTDLHKGWDGYFGNNRLALQGVYVWKVVGRFADGIYFNEVGDVTFLH